MQTAPDIPAATASVGVWIAFGTAIVSAVAAIWVAVINRRQSRDGLELTSWQQQWDEIQEEVKRLRMQMREADEDNGKLRSELRKIAGERDQYERELRIARAENAALTERVQSLETDVAAIRSEYEHQLERLRADLDGALATIAGFARHPSGPLSRPDTTS